MKKTLRIVLCVVFLSTGALFLAAPFVACKSTDTREAVTYHSFRDTWNVAHAAYAAFCERVVQGKATKEQEVQADAAWNTFRASFRTALLAAGQNWSAAPPVEVKSLADKMVTTLKTP